MQERDLEGDAPEPRVELRPRQLERPDPDQSLWQRFAEAEGREEFCRSWLALQGRMMPDAQLGLLVLGPPGTGPYTPVATWPDGRAEVKRLAEAAERALVNRQAVVLRRPAISQNVHVAWPVRVDGELHGVAVFELAARDEVGVQRALRQLQWGTCWLEVLFRRELSRRVGDPVEVLRTVFDVTAAVVENDGFQASATALVNELATRLECARVSLGMVRKARVELRAMSHSTHFAGKANLVRAIESAMEEAFDQEQVVVWPRLPDDGFQVSLAHEELQRQSAVGSLCSLPLGRGGVIQGVLTLERSASRPFERSTVELVEAISALIGPLLELERRDERWVGRKVWDATRAQARALIGPRHVALKLATASLVLGFVFFFFARMDYRVSATSAIEAEIQRVAVVPFSGYVIDAPFRAGDLVQAGDVMCVLDDRELQLERHRLKSREGQLEKERDVALADRKGAQLKIVSAQIEQVRAQLELVEAQLERTRVLSPLAGIVVSGDLSQAIGAPVERGQVLFEVAPLDAYRVVLEVDERDVDEVAPGQSGSVVLSALPGEPFPLVVETVTPVSAALEGRNVFRVEAALQRVDERLRPGLEGVGKIEVGRRRVIWVWTHRAVDWLRLFVWRWSP
jgi:multidrug resistance efflux pump